MPDKIDNVAVRFERIAAARPDQIAIATPTGIGKRNYIASTKRAYRKITFAQLSRRVNRVADGLQSLGFAPGDRIVLLVPFGEDFITLVFALLKLNVTLILIDPGMPRKYLLDSLSQSQPDGFVAIGKAQLIRKLYQRRFPKAFKNVVVGRRMELLGLPGLLRLPRYENLLRQTHAHAVLAPTFRDTPAAIIFTTGSTGPPKGVLYTHETFNSQIDQLVERYEIEPGGTDLACFPLFGLFNAVMGTTTIIPDMDSIRPANIDPPRLLDAIDQWHINQAFGSPALWKAMAKFTDATNRTCPSLRLVLSAGAAVPVPTLASLKKLVAADGEIFTPYGATESLPVASISASEVLDQTAARTLDGAGTCVGKKFAQIEWKIIAITDEPLPTIDLATELPAGELGEIIVCGPVVSKQYVTRTDQNALHKIQDGDSIWHRIGDVGYLDQQQRFWFCGRKSQRVVLADGSTLFTEPCEAIINTHPLVSRSALVGVGPSEAQQPVVVLELQDYPSLKSDVEAQQRILREVRDLASKHMVTAKLEDYRVYPGTLPTDIRHNSKIFREQLRDWAG